MQILLLNSKKYKGIFFLKNSFIKGVQNKNKIYINSLLVGNKLKYFSYPNWKITNDQWYAITQTCTMHRLNYQSGN